MIAKIICTNWAGFTFSKNQIGAHTWVCIRNCHNKESEQLKKAFAVAKERVAVVEALSEDMAIHVAREALLLKIMEELNAPKVDIQTQQAVLDKAKRVAREVETVHNQEVAEYKRVIAEGKAKGVPGLTHVEPSEDEKAISRFFNWLRRNNQKITVFVCITFVLAIILMARYNLISNTPASFIGYYAILCIIVYCIRFFDKF